MPPEYLAVAGGVLPGIEAVPAGVLLPLGAPRPRRCGSAVSGGASLVRGAHIAASSTGVLFLFMTEYSAGVLVLSSDFCRFWWVGKEICLKES